MKKSKAILLIEAITLLVYMTLLVIIMIYHEPWYDEAEAWLISRDECVNSFV